MSGKWVLVCGASGAGKDSVMAWAQNHLVEHPQVVFSRRMVTRPAQTGSDHDEVSPSYFEQLLETRALAWHWQAHGFGYGVSTRYASDVAAGRVVVVNGSREHVNTLGHAQALGHNVRVVQVLADAHQLEQRLQQRGRDSTHAVAQRMARNSQFADLRADCTIVNNGALADAGLQLAHYLRKLAEQSAD